MSLGRIVPIEAATVHGTNKLRSYLILPGVDHDHTEIPNHEPECSISEHQCRPASRTGMANIWRVR